MYVCTNDEYLIGTIYDNNITKITKTKKVNKILKKNQEYFGK